MLPSEKEPNKNDKETTLICDEFEGEFMSLYFQHKETECLI